MGTHVAGLGKSLDQAVGRYNQFVGSLESQVMVSARRMEELGGDHQGRTLPEGEQIDKSARALSRPELLKAPDSAE